jgi:hypothetical protein
MSESGMITTYSYTPAQAEVLRLQERYRRCLLDQKYYAYRLALYQRWDIATNLLAGVAMLLSLVTRPSSHLWLSYVCYGTGVLAALMFISKPVLKMSEQIERYTILHYSYAELFNKIEALVSDIRRNGGMTAEHRVRSAEIFDSCAALALREDPTYNAEKLAAFKAEVEKAIPPETLWLPLE